MTTLIGRHMPQQELSELSKLVTDLEAELQKPHGMRIISGPTNWSGLMKHLLQDARALIPVQQVNFAGLTPTEQAISRIVDAQTQGRRLGGA